jgi:hypothetical protein
MSKSLWGPPCWSLMHVLATRIKEEDFENKKESLWLVINEICNNLPCPECRQHAVSLMRQTKKASILKSKDNLELFLFDFHNLVNKTKGLKLFTKEEYNLKYKKENIRDIVFNFINIFNASARNNNLMTDAFHRQRFIQKFIAWINVNKESFI